jgi:rhodanese-related sulfurtransferase
LQTKGLQLASSNQVNQLFQDPRCQQGLILFVDARDDAHFQAGHIPGAYQLDYYHPEKHLGTLLPLCQVAHQVVIYCNGGECEDSELAATFLASAGIAREKLLVYGGGISEWGANGLSIEVGERSSGQMRTNAPR